MLSLGLVLFVLLARPAMRLEAKAVLVCLAGLAFNRFYSTQFHLWFYPFLIALVLTNPDLLRARRLAVVAVVLDVLNVFVYPVALAYAYTEMGGFAVLGAAARGGPWTVAFTGGVILRVAAVCVLAVLVWRSDALPRTIPAQRFP